MRQYPSRRGLAFIRPLTFALGAAVALPAPVTAQSGPGGAVTTSVSAALVSDYRLRGVSRSGGGPAVQGAVSFDHASGLSAGVWASTLARAAGPGTAEVDLFAGYSRDVLPGITATGGLQFYAFPGAPAGQRGLFEPYAGLSASYGPARVKLDASYAWAQAAAGSADSLYLRAAVDAAVPGTPLTVAAHLGHQGGALPGPMASGPAAAIARRSGWDYALGGTLVWQRRVTLGLTWIGTDRPAVAGLTDDRLVASLTLSL